MSLLLEAADDPDADDWDAMAKAAREAIDLRLRLRNGEDVARFWSAVAKLYARGLPEIAAVTPVARVALTPSPDRTLPEVLPAGHAAPAP